AKKRKDELATRVHLERTVQSLNIDDELINEIWGELSGTRNSTPLIAENYQLHIPPSIPDDAVIASKGNFTFKVSDLKQEGAYTPDINLSRIDNSYRFSEFTRGLAFRSFILAEFAKKYNPTAPEIVNSVNHTFYGFL